MKQRCPLVAQGEPALSATHGERRVELHVLTEQAGAACLLLDDDLSWSLEGHLAVVENLECFLHYEDLDLSVDALDATGCGLEQEALLISGG